MAHATEPAFEEMLWTIAITRLLFGPSMNIQAPPNLTPGKLITQIALDQLVPDRYRRHSTVALVVSYQHPYAHAALLRPGCACLAGPDGGEAGWRALILAGANDFGGISPVTKDYVNPEKPWPHLHSLAAATAAAGKALVPRYCFGPHKQASLLADFRLLDITSPVGQWIHCQVICWGGSNLWQVLCVCYIAVTSSSRAD